MLYTDMQIHQYKIKMCDVCRSLEINNNQLEYTNDQHDKYPTFACFLCKLNSNNINDSSLSPIAFGLLSLFIYQNHRYWIHEACLRWFSPVIKLEIIENSTFFIGLKLDKQLDEKTFTYSCDICMYSDKKDFFIKCYDSNCSYYSHRKCLEELERQGKLNIFSVLPNSKNEIKEKCYLCQIHSNSNDDNVCDICACKCSKFIFIRNFGFHSFYFILI